MPPPVNTRTLSNYLASLQATPAEDVTLVTQNLETWSTDNLVSPSDLAPVAFSGVYSDLTGLPTLGTASAQDVSYFALAASGALAETALQPSDVGTMAYEDVGDFATYAQGQRADTAVQSVVAGASISVNNADPQNPIISFTGGTGTGTVVAVVAGDGIDVDSTDEENPIVSLDAATQASLLLADGSVQSVVAGTNVTIDNTDPANPIISASGGGGGGSVVSVVEGTGIDVDDTDPANPIVSIQAGYLATVATTGAYNDLTGKPTLGTAAATNSTDYATAAQGAKADTALQPAAIGSTVQAFDADLSSWAAVTRATGFDAFTATPSSANLRALLTDEVGTGSAYFVGGALGTPASVTLTNGTGLPISTGVSGLGTNVATFLATPSSANLRAALTDEVGTGAAYFVGGALGTPASGTATNLTGLPLTSGVTGTLPVANGGTGRNTLTANSLLAGNGTTQVNLIAPGASGNVLTSNGTTWASAAPAGGTPGIIPLGTIVTASSSAALDFVFSGSYSEYILKFWNIKPGTDANTLYFRTSANSGSSFDSGGTDYELFQYYASSTATTIITNGGQDNKILLTKTGGVGSDLNEEGVSGEVRIFKPTQSAFCNIRSDTAFSDTAGGIGYCQGAGRRRAAAAVNAVRLLFGSGTITSGTAQLYGVVTA